MTDEERQRAMDFIVEQQAQFSVNQQKGEQRISRLERILKLMVRAGRRTRRQLRELDERCEQRFAKLTDALTPLADAQKRTEASVARTDASVAHLTKRIDALVDIVRSERNGKS